MTDDATAQVKSYTYRAFGRIRSESGEMLLNRVAYTGRYALGDSFGWYYYRYRIYDPRTGRFISGDPLWFRDGPNLFTYARNNPVDKVDPFGLASRIKIPKLPLPKKPPLKDPPVPNVDLTPQDPAKIAACIECARLEAALKKL
ncbi:MAG: RHS repeat-associated core domain-containing protein [Kiritimatiellae bacterium]|nr:RHS repeat-associated core domain-containing protein [Kiritimatiellia bacterium]